MIVVGNKTSHRDLDEVQTNPVDVLAVNYRYSVMLRLYLSAFQRYKKFQLSYVFLGKTN